MIEPTEVLLTCPNCLAQWVETAYGSPDPYELCSECEEALDDEARGWLP